MSYMGTLHLLLVSSLQSLWVLTIPQFMPCWIPLRGGYWDGSVKSVYPKIATFSEQPAMVAHEQHWHVKGPHQVISSGTPPHSRSRVVANCCWQISSTLIKSFDKVVEVLAEVGQCLPQFQKYAELFKENQHIKQVLCLFYRDILDFHATVLNFFRKNSMYILHPHFQALD